MVQTANMGHHLAGGNSSWCPELESRATHRPLTRSKRVRALLTSDPGYGQLISPSICEKGTKPPAPGTQSQIAPAHTKHPGRHADLGVREGDAPVNSAAISSSCAAMYPQAMAPRLQPVAKTAEASPP